LEISCAASTQLKLGVNEIGLLCGIEEEEEKEEEERRASNGDDEIRGDGGELPELVVLPLIGLSELEGH